MVSVQNEFDRNSAKDLAFKTGAKFQPQPRHENEKQPKENRRIGPLR